MKDQVIKVSDKFWKAMENADEAGMRALAVPDCTFVHIGVTCELDKEIEFYTKGIFKPTKLVFHSKNARVYGDTAIVITDCDYSLLLGGKPTTHHFAVTEVYSLIDNEWKLVQFSFTALVYPSSK
jgi:ketosteroid isomerase-like protein